MEFITFELIGKIVCLISIVIIVFKILWWCFDILPMKLVYMIEGNIAFFEFLSYRKKFKEYLKEKNQKL